MDKYLEDCLNGQEPGKYIFPFFWQHGETHEILLEEIEAIQRSGIKEFCVESRVHEKFCETNWWTDMEFILKEAGKRNMRVWLLDDKKFPTGYANGWIHKHPELKKVSLRLEYMDVPGPLEGCALLANRLKAGESYVSISAWRRKEEAEVFFTQQIDLLQSFNRGLVYFDVPPGIWRVFFVIRTYDTVPGKEDYIDLLSEESCKAMIESIYEPHYVRFKKYFGNVFAGFFFDEPGFGNDDQTYYSKLGKANMLIPWNDDLLPLLGSRLDMETVSIRGLLPALWQDIGEKTPWIRMAYMDIVSKRMRHNFSDLLGNWCREHGVMSVGHLIEDMNAHMRLGYGAAHYFRGLDGQDMAGMDIVLGQIYPGIHKIPYAAPVIEDMVDPLFFTYTLPKLAASHAHFNKRKKGRAMCEIFGAFGWAEGLPMMKQIADEMLVSGINYFVPHAFSPKYPDPDCPPHFFARGNQPQFPLFGRLISYMRRCCHLLSDGIHQAPVAILYHAEAEWAGGEYLPLEKLTGKLAWNQVDFDILPEDELYGAICCDGGIRVYQETYRVLLVPGCEYLPEKLLDKINCLAEDGATVYFVGRVPDIYKKPEGRRYSISYEELIKTLYSAGIMKLLSGPISDTLLRIYHYRRKNTHVFVFLNEDRNREWSGDVRIQEEKGVFYDPWDNKLYYAEFANGLLYLHLFPGELKIFLSGDYESGLLEKSDGFFSDKTEGLQLDLKYQVSLWDNTRFSLYNGKMGLVNLSNPELLPEFSGRIRYEASFWLTNASDYRCIDLCRVGEVVEIWVNDIYCGAKIVPPYFFFIDEILIEGWNKLRIEVVNNLGYKERDSLSRYVPLPPSGLLGPLKLKK